MGPAGWQQQAHDDYCVPRPAPLTGDEVSEIDRRLTVLVHACISGKKKPKKNVAVSTCSSCTSSGSLVLLVHRCHCHRVHIRHTCSDACVYVRAVAENEGIGLERGALVSKGPVYVYIL